MIDDYGARIRTLNQLKVKLEDDARKKETLRAGIEEKKREIETDKKRKADYLAKVRKDKDTYAASLKQLEANAARLQAMMQKLEDRSRKSYSKKTAPPQAKDAPSAARPVTVPTAGFGGRKRQLALPVHGEIIQRFGKHKHPEFNSFTFSNGLAISAPAGADIRAVDGGTVIFANYFKGYGNMVILDHGDGFFSVYAHASHIARKEGSSVTRNDVIASVGDLDSSRGPMLYFEIRYQGKPVDPSPWFK
jgi:septal ring factor EnvC (AmiA/AmiB activator)